MNRNLNQYIVECKCNWGPLLSVNRKTRCVTLTLQLDLFIIYTQNDNATYICAQLRHLHFNNICVTKKTEKGIIVFISTGNDPWSATEIIWLTPKPLESTVNNTASVQKAILRTDLLIPVISLIHVFPQSLSLFDGLDKSYARNFSCC